MSIYDRQRSATLLAEIRRDLAEVDNICSGWEEGSDREEAERVDGLIQGAFESALVLMETIGRSDTRGRILGIRDAAKKNFHDVEYSVNAGGLYSPWSYQLSLILDAVEKVQFQSFEGFEEPLDKILQMLQRFVLVERSLQHRYDSRPAIEL